jgi:hypothetical protein
MPDRRSLIFPLLMVFISLMVHSCVGFMPIASFISIRPRSRRANQSPLITNEVKREVRRTFLWAEQQGVELDEERQNPNPNPTPKALSNQSKNEFSNQLNNELEKELKKEPAGNLFASIATRIILTPSILGLTALLGHNYITGPLPWNAMTNFGMGLIEVGSFTIVGFVLSLFSVFQYLLVDRLFLDNAIRKTIRALMSDEQDSKAGAGLESTVRKLVTQLREAPGVEGFLFRFVLDVSGVFSEPGIVRLIEDVTKRDGGVYIYMCLYVYVYVYMYIYLYIYINICIKCMYIHFFAYIYISIRNCLLLIFMYLYVYLYRQCRCCCEDKAINPVGVSCRRIVNRAPR